MVMTGLTRDGECLCGSAMDGRQKIIYGLEDSFFTVKPTT